MWVGIVCVAVVSIATPLALLAVSLRKMFEFYHFVGHVADNARREELWGIFAVAYPSSFTSLYVRFRFMWAFFGSVLMVMRAALALIVIGAEQDSTVQAALTVVLLAFFLLFIAIIKPFQVHTQFTRSTHHTHTHSCRFSTASTFLG